MNPSLDPLAGLHKMSTTAGVASAQYRAVNIASVISILLGLASGLVFLSSVLLFIPIAGILVAILALVQIGRSAGTEYGRLLAYAAIALSLLCAGGKLGSTAYQQHRARQDEKQIAAVIDQFAQQVRVGDWKGAWQLYSPAARQKLKPEDLQHYWQSLQNMGGKLRSLTWNGMPPAFALESGSGVRTATLLVIADQPLGQSRIPVRMTETGGKWEIAEFPIPGQ